MLSLPDVDEAVVWAWRVMRVDGDIVDTSCSVYAGVDHDRDAVGLRYGHEHDLIAPLTWPGHVGQVGGG